MTEKVKGREIKYEREHIVLYTPKMSFGFEIKHNLIWFAPKELKSWEGISIEDFAKKVIAEFGLCWKMVFHTFDGNRWHKGHSSINWNY